MVSRTCDSETGTWSDIDFSQCTLTSAQHAFVLLWITLSTGNIPMVNNRKMNIANDVRRGEDGETGKRGKEGGRDLEGEEREGKGKEERMGKRDMVKGKRGEEEAERE